MVATTAEPDPIPPDIRTVIDLFATQLAKVAFPDVDAASLRREADELRAEAANVARARAALDAALAAQTRKHAALSATAARAVAYARIYADAHPEREQLVAALAAPVEAAPAAKRRGRPPRRSADLFDASTLPPGPPHEPPAG